MSSTSRTLGLLLCVSLAACGGGGDSPDAEKPLNVDYSTLKVAESRDNPLQYASSDEQILSPLRNGVRLMTLSGGLPGDIFTATTGGAGGGSYSNPTVQVAGVDEADAVRYDGRYIYTARSADSHSSGPPYVLAIARTDTVAGTV